MNRLDHPAHDPLPVPGDAVELIRPYLEGRLGEQERSQVEAYALQDEQFAGELRQRRVLLRKMEQAYGARALGAGFQEAAERKLLHATSSIALPAAGIEREAAEASVQAAPRGLLNALEERFGMAPWWIVSAALHVLVITLLGLITMAIGLRENSDRVIVLTNLEKVSQVKPAEEARKNKADLRDVLESKHETPATDPDSQKQSAIVVPPDILAKAELGDHFETINLDRPDTQSAFGNPEARMFHSTSGNDEPEGGGGFGGAGLMDDLIGAGGSSSPGTGGGWGGGNGTGSGLVGRQIRGGIGARGQF